VFRDPLGSSKAKPTQPAQSAPPALLPASETILGSGTQLEGRLTSPGHVRIEGSFVGDVSACGCVTIGEQAKLDGDLIGEVVAVSGIVRGDVIARKVSVLRTGRVWGDLRAEQLATEEGGFIQGQVIMEEKVDLAAALSEHAPAAAPEPEAAEEQAAPEEPVPAPVLRSESRTPKPARGR
jgi:cytoskeletal protein CcmA (bactofilin family)